MLPEMCFIEGEGGGGGGGGVPHGLDRDITLRAQRSGHSRRDKRAFCFLRAVYI